MLQNYVDEVVAPGSFFMEAISSVGYIDPILPVKVRSSIWGFKSSGRPQHHDDRVLLAPLPLRYLFTNPPQA